MFSEEAYHFIERYRILTASVIQVRMYCARDDHKLFIIRILAAFDHVFIGISAHIARVRVFTMYDQHRAANLITVLQDRLVQEGHRAYSVPAVIGVQGTRMVTTIRLIIIVVVLYEQRRILWQGIDYAAAELIYTIFIIL